MSEHLTNISISNYRKFLRIILVLIVVAIITIVILVVTLSLFAPERVVTFWTAYQLDRSIAIHADKHPYRQDFTVSIELVEKLVDRGETDAVLDVLIRNIGSGNSGQQFTSMTLLYFTEREKARAAIPVLQQVANDPSEDEGVRGDAEIMIKQIRGEMKLKGIETKGWK